MNKKLITGIAIGVGISALTAYLYGTKQGKEVRDTAVETTEDWWEDIAEVLEEALDKLSDRLNKK